MEAVQTLRFQIVIAAAVLAMFGCTSRQIVEDHEARFKDINDEFDKMVKVQPGPKPTITPMPTPTLAQTKASPTPPVAAGPTPTLKPLATPTPAPIVAPKQVAPAVPEKGKKKVKREPVYEDAEGFVGRRPALDPFREGERVVLSVNYFNMSAGDLAFEVLPFKEVNSKKAYHFRISVKSHKLFNVFYSVDNQAETFMDFETLRPVTLTIDAKESSRVKESRTFFDWATNQATMWEKTVKRSGDEKKRKKTWAIETYMQNIISAIFYMRAFTLTPGKTLEFKVADDGKNYTFKGEVVRRETLKTAVGDLATVVVRPKFTLDGEFKQTGENLIWVTDDDRKLIVRIESKIKIGTLVANLKSIAR